MKIKEDFSPLTETENILSISVLCSTFAQRNKLHTGALSFVAQQCVTRKSRNDRVSMIDLNDEIQNYTMQRTN